MLFCTDGDLLFYEPTLLRECKVLAVPLASGNCVVAGTTLTASAAHFTGSAVRVGMLVAIDNRPAGIVRAITSDTVLRVAVAHPWVDEADGVEASIGDGSALAFAVYSFPQLLPPAAEIRAALDLNDATFDPEPLRRVNALGALAAIFRSMAATDHTIYTPTTGSFDTYTANAGYQTHAAAYETQYRNALKLARVHVETDGGGTEPRTTSSSRIIRE